MKSGELMSDGTKRQMTEQEEMDYEMRPEYDFSKAVRNPYAARARAGGTTDLHVVTIEPELFEKFPSSEAVNEALRAVLKQRELDGKQQDAA
jgi:hypothetical protein